MFTIILSSIAFLGGIYVGARWAEWLRECYYAITGK